MGQPSTFKPPAFKPPTVQPPKMENEAQEYLKKHKITEFLNHATESMVYTRPPRVNSYLIKRLKEILDVYSLFDNENSQLYQLYLKDEDIYQDDFVARLDHDLKTNTCYWAVAASEE